MKQNILSHLLLMSLIGSSLVAMDGRRKPFSFERNPPQLLDFAPGLADLDAIQQLESKKEPDLAEVHGIFENLASIKSFSEKGKNLLQDLKNISFTLCADEPLYQAFKGSSQYRAFVSQFVKLLGMCRHVSTAKATAARQGEKDVLSSAKKLIEQAESYLEEYSAQLEAGIEKAFCSFRQAYSQRLSPRERQQRMAKVGRTLETLNQERNTCHTLETKSAQAWTTAGRLINVAKRANKALWDFQEQCQLETQRGIGRNQPQRHNNELNELKTARRHANAKATEARTASDRIALQYRNCQLACQKAEKEYAEAVSCHEECAAVEQDYAITLEHLKAALQDFEKRTSKLLNIRACVRATSFGRIKDDLLMALFMELESDDSMKKLVQRCHTGFSACKNKHYMEELSLTLQHYVCLRNSPKPADNDAAKGFSWELGVGVFLLETLGIPSPEDSHNPCERLVTLSTHLTNIAKDKSREVDATTSHWIIECKNLNWKTRFDAKRKAQLTQQATLAQQLGKRYVVISKQIVPDHVAQWFRENSIPFIDPDHKNMPLGGFDCSKLFTEEFLGL